MKRRMRNIHAMGHHYGGYDGEDYDELCEYAKNMEREWEDHMHKLDEIYAKIEGHPEHHRRGYSYRHREGEYEGHKDHDGYEMYDEGHRRERRSYYRPRRSGEHYVRGHYSR